MAEYCNVCVEEYSKMNVKMTCPYCNYDSCVNCFKTYNTSTIKQIECMNCHHELLYKRDVYIMSNKKITQKWFNEALSEKIYNEELKKMYSSQINLYKEKTLLELTDELNYYNSIMKLNKKHKYKYGNNDEAQKKATICMENIEKINKIIISKCLKCESGLLMNINIINNNLDFNNTNKTMKCFKCDNKSCVKCGNNDITDDHKCKKEDIVNMEEIINSTKSCPCCYTRIYKIDGCDQMYCIHCKTLFSWQTGTIDYSKGHNPHFINEQNVITRDLLDIPCGRELDVNDFDLYASKNYNFIHRNKVFGFSFLRIYNLHSLITNIQDKMSFNNEKNRNKFIEGKISIDLFKKNTFKNYSNAKYYSDLVQIIASYRTNATEIIHLMFHNLHNVKKNDYINIDRIINNGICKLRILDSDIIRKSIINIDYKYQGTRNIWHKFDQRYPMYSLREIEQLKK